MAKVSRLYFKCYLYADCVGSSNKYNHKCYVCGLDADYLMKAYSASDKSARKILEMYKVLGLYAAITPHDATTLEVGACPEHIPNLKRLREESKATERITLKSIVDSLK